MATYFPKDFRKGVDAEYNNELLKKLRIEVSDILDGFDNSEQIFKHEKNMLQMDLPNIWNVNSRGNMEVEMETEFEKFLLAISEHTNEDVKNITVFRFYALIGYIKEKNPKK